MVITYQGDNYFKIQSGSFTALIDPTNSRSLKGANLILNTTKPTSVSLGKDKETASSSWIDNQGEYEVEGTRVLGVSTQNNNSKENTAYLFEIEGMKIGILGHITKEPTPEIIEKFQKVDILILPVSGTPLIGESEAAKLVRQVEPSIIIPTLIKSKPKKFFAELNQDPKPEEKLVMKKKDLSPQAMSLVYLKV